MVLSPQEHKLLDALIARLSGLGAVSRIIVFGSRARGRSGEDSDLDVLVLLSRRDPSLVRRIEVLKQEALPDIEDFFQVNLVPLVEEEYLRDRGLFRRNVDRDGVTVWKRA